MNVRFIRLIAAAFAAATVSLFQPTAVRGDELGRLFFTPQQRQDLDRRRQSNIRESEPPVVESSVTVNGHVARSSGKTTTWVNGVPQYDSYSSRDPGRVHLDTATVKIGQTLDRARGEVHDQLGSGEVKVNRPADGASR